MPRAGVTDGDRAAVADGLLTVAEAAAFLRVSRAKLYQVLDAGELPSLKIGTRRLVPRRAAVEYAAGKLARAGGGPDPAA